MPGNDWIVGGNRRTIAAERIYAAATDLITRYGLNALDIDKLAREVHCSRATIYRRAGGKAQIRDVVLTRAAARIADGVRSDVETLRGRERVVAAILLSLQRIRSDPLGKLSCSARSTVAPVNWPGSPSHRCLRTLLPSSPA
ncbi:transcriptional regulator [Mycobacterium tuberculosis]|nr:transcriptional regulator [Mycobacterium tuberculosis]